MEQLEPEVLPIEVQPVRRRGKDRSPLSRAARQGLKLLTRGESYAARRMSKDMGISYDDAIRMICTTRFAERAHQILKNKARVDFDLIVYEKMMEIITDKITDENGIEDYRYAAKDRLTAAATLQNMLPMKSDASAKGGKGATVNLTFFHDLISSISPKELNRAAKTHFPGIDD